MGTPAAFMRRRASVLSPIVLMAEAGGPTKTSPAPPHGLRERRPLGEEAVAGMNCLTPGRLGSGDQLGDVEIGLGGRRGADQHGRLRRANVWGETVGFGVHGDGLKTLFVAGADDAEGDLAAGGGQAAVDPGRLPGTHPFLRPPITRYGPAQR